jgi:MoxR-like ATPase
MSPSPAPIPSSESLRQGTERLLNQLNTVIVGKHEQVTLSVICLLASGHLLIEDVPGVGKTTLSHALAHSLGLSFRASSSRPTCCRPT